MDVIVVHHYVHYIAVVYAAVYIVWKMKKCRKKELTVGKFDFADLKGILFLYTNDSNRHQ